MYLAGQISHFDELPNTEYSNYNPLNIVKCTSMKETIYREDIINSEDNTRVYTRSYSNSTSSTRRSGHSTRLSSYKDTLQTSGSDISHLRTSVHSSEEEGLTAKFKKNSYETRTDKSIMTSVNDAKLIGKFRIFYTDSDGECNHNGDSVCETYLNLDL